MSYRNVKTLSQVGLSILLSVWLVTSVDARSVTVLRSAVVETYFSPNGGATQAIVDLIANAKHRVALAGYGFTSERIANALLAAHRRGIDVRIVLDKSNVFAKHSRGDALSRAGIDVRSQHAYGIMHHKFLLVDNVVAFGSMNASESGEVRNAENWNVFRNAADLALIYEREFDRLRNGARPFVYRYAPQESAPSPSAL